MRYLVTLKPLTPFFFGGHNTFGTLGDKETGSYLAVSRRFPQPTMILGMLQKEIMTQSGHLTRKRRGEWVDKPLRTKAATLVGQTKFDFDISDRQDFGSIRNIGAVFLTNGMHQYIKKVNIDDYPYSAEGDHPKLIDYDAKKEEKLFDHYISTDSPHNPLSSSDIFIPVEQVGNRKVASRASLADRDDARIKAQKEEANNAYFKKTSYTLARGFAFAFYLESDFELKHSIVSLGADGGRFKMTIIEVAEKTLDYQAPHGHLVLLSDALVELPIEETAEFAVTSEVELRYFKGRSATHAPTKTHPWYLYEKGSIFIKPKQSFIDALNHTNLQQIGFNHHTYQTQGAQA